MTSRIGAALLGLCVAASLCGASLTGASPAHAEDVIRLGLPAADNAFYALFGAAEQLGYYKDANLKVEITVYRGGAAAQEAMNAGAADVIGYFGAGAALAISKGAKSAMVAALSERPAGWYILADSKSGITSMKDLDGKKVGISSKGGVTDMFALWAADRAGVSITTVPIGSGALVPATKAGQVSAIPCFPSLSLRLIASGEMRPLVDLGKDMVPTYPDVIVASEAAMTTQAAQLRAFLAASFKALDRMQHDQTFGLSYLKIYTSETNDKINQQVYEQIIRTQPANGEIKPEGIQNSVRIAGKAWGMDDLPKIDPMTVYTTKFLPGSKS
jgi:ABC-type nitrate/sulfonate/bicarbonate transport system substrate-binding protein